MKIKQILRQHRWNVSNFKDSLTNISIMRRLRGVSDRQLYMQAGNAVTVTVVYEIAKRLG